MTDLLTAVHALTRPTIEHLRQVDDDGNFIKNHTAEHPPLLTQLEMSVFPGSESVAGSSSSPSTRNLIDADAAFEFHKMSAAAGDWCRMVGLRSTRYVIKDLEQWYPAYSATDSDHEWYTRELKRWARVIRNILEPPKKFEVAVTCPVCKNDHWTNPDGESMPWPILVEYTMPEGTIKARASCRVEGCGASWDSYDAIEELGEEISEQHAQEIPTTLEEISATM